MDEQRSRETRARAELALVRLLHALGDEDVFLARSLKVAGECRYRRSPAKVDDRDANSGAHVVHDLI